MVDADADAAVDAKVDLMSPESRKERIDQMLAEGKFYFLAEPAARLAHLIHEHDTVSLDQSEPGDDEYKRVAATFGLPSTDKLATQDDGQTAWTIDEEAIFDAERNLVLTVPEWMRFSYMDLFEDKIPLFSSIVKYESGNTVAAALHSARIEFIDVSDLHRATIDIAMETGVLVRMA